MTTATLRPILKGWSHTLAAVAAAIVGPFLIATTPVGLRTVASIFAVSVLALFTVSAVYHRFKWGPQVRAVMRRLDHSMIYIVIAATYTPLAAVSLEASKVTWVLGSIWTATVLGVMAKIFWLNAPRWVTSGLYIAMGWAALGVLGDFLRQLGAAGFILLVAGGLLHTVGAVIYATKKPNPSPRWFGFHEVFHLFVIGGITCHYLTVAFFALR